MVCGPFCPRFWWRIFLTLAHSAALTAGAEARANDFVHSFAALGYALPVVGALLADWVLGKYRVILYLSLFYCLGHALLAAYTDDLAGFRAGLLVIAIGMGGIKSSVTANLGDQFDQTQLPTCCPRPTVGFNSPSMRARRCPRRSSPSCMRPPGAAWAFGVPGLLMGAAALTFWLGRRHYVRVPPTGLLRRPAPHAGPRRKPGRAAPDEAPFFYSSRCYGRCTIKASQSGCCKPPTSTATCGPAATPRCPSNCKSLVLCSVSGSTRCLPTAFTRRWRGAAFGPRRCGAWALGMVLVALAMVHYCRRAAPASIWAASPSVWWQVLAYFVVAGGTLMVAVTGLEYAYTHAPPTLKSLTTSLWLLTIAGGNYFLAIMNASIARGGFFARFQGANYYWFFVGLMAVNFTLFILIASRLTQKTYVGSLPLPLEPLAE